ncbi:hypothetical protein ES703_80665 [subsurface metagenome]
MRNALVVERARLLALITMMRGFLILEQPACRSAGVKKRESFSSYYIVICQRKRGRGGSLATFVKMSPSLYVSSTADQMLLQ